MALTQARQLPTTARASERASERGGSAQLTDYSALDGRADVERALDVLHLAVGHLGHVGEGHAAPLARAVERLLQRGAAAAAHARDLLGGLAAVLVLLLSVPALLALAAARAAHA